MCISVVILSYNAERSLHRCLESLLDALGGIDGDHEVFVVDNGSVDGSKGIIEEFHERHPETMRPICFPDNTGTTFSRNAAMRKTSGRYVLILDSDAYVGRDALSRLMDCLEADAGTGLAAPRLFYASGSFQLSCDVFPTLLHKLRRFLFLKRMEREQHALQAVSEPVDVDYAISACWLLRRDVVDGVGLFDERIFYSPEDVDYCLRVWEAGFRVTYVPDAHVTHDAQELSRGFRLSSFHFSHLAGLFYLFRKHGYFWGLRSLYRRIDRFRTPGGVPGHE